MVGRPGRPALMVARLRVGLDIWLKLTFKKFPSKKFPSVFLNFGLLKIFALVRYENLA